MFRIEAKTELFAGNGEKGGVIQVVSSDSYWPGSTCYISADSLAGIKGVILRIVDSTHIQIKLHEDEGWISNTQSRNVGITLPDLTAYTTAANAQIGIPVQTVFWNPGGGVIPKIPTYWHNS
jgi:hypothetical protein